MAEIESLKIKELIEIDLGIGAQKIPAKSSFPCGEKLPSIGDDQLVINS